MLDLKQSLKTAKVTASFEEAPFTRKTAEIKVHTAASSVLDFVDFGNKSESFSILCG
jgi:hypothetical protein